MPSTQLSVHWHCSLHDSIKNYKGPKASNKYDNSITGGLFTFQDNYRRASINVKYWQSSHNKTSVSTSKGRINYRLLRVEYFYKSRGWCGTGGEENICDHFNEITMKLTFRKAHFASITFHQKVPLPKFCFSIKRLTALQIKIR